MTVTIELIPSTHARLINSINSTGYYLIIILLLIYYMCPFSDISLYIFGFNSFSKLIVSVCGNLKIAIGISAHIRVMFAYYAWGNSNR